MYGAEPENMVSEGWRYMIDLSSTTSPNVSFAAEDEDHFCKLILYKEIKNSRVRIWDVLILIPNLLFLLFIAIRFNRARLKLRATSSPIFLAFYGLVNCNVVISVIRCVVSMTVNAAATVGGKADKVLWVTVRFFLLSTEMSVVIFGLAFGHLDSRSSIRRVLFATSFIALAFTITQGTLELVLPDDTFHIPSRDFYVFGHGGMMFWFCSSLVFTMIYLFILILPWTRLRDRLALPTRKSFYVYAGTLASLDLVQSIGAGFLNYTQNPIGLCIVDFTAVVYLTLFTPLVYHTFLSEFFGVSQPSIMFSYKPQVDDAMDEDTVSLPHQQSFSSLKTDSDYIYQVHTPSMYMPLYDSQASKSSPSRQRTSLYSLTSTKDSKSSSQGTLYRSTSGIKSLTKHLSGEKSTHDLRHYPLKRSDTFSGIQKSSPDLRLTNPTWTTRSSQGKFEGPSSVSNIILSSTAANIPAGSHIHKSSTADKALNILSRKQETSLGQSAFLSLEKSASDILTTDTKSLDETVSPKLSKKMFSEEFLDIPPLENTLQSILETGVHKSTIKCSVTKESDLKSSSTSKYTDAESSEAFSEDTLSTSSDASNVMQKLIPASSPFAEMQSHLKKRRESNPQKQESGGLSEYLMSLSSPSSLKQDKNDRSDSNPSPGQSPDSSNTQPKLL